MSSWPAEMDQSADVECDGPHRCGREQLHGTDSMSRTCRISVDLPPVFGPVSSMKGACFVPKSMLLGTKAPAPESRI